MDDKTNADGMDIGFRRGQSRWASLSCTDVILSRFLPHSSDLSSLFG
jgi:hypothetical protein